MSQKVTLRLCEWAGISTRGRLTGEQRAEIDAAARAWKELHRLPHPPLAFSGPGGEFLTARQYVGVVEAGDVQIEVYPKLDAYLLETAELDEETPAAIREGVLANLLYLMEKARQDSPFETETAALAETPATFIEVFALLLARNLRAELAHGMVRRYLPREDELKMVRGRVELRRQVTQHWNRMDKIACAWDEFTPDVTLNRVFRCACRLLHQHISSAATRYLLTECLEMLEEVEEVPVPVALAAARNLRHFDRVMERFRLSYQLALRLLSATGHALQTDSAETFVFLVDMNDLFERYAHAVLEQHFGVTVRQQEPVWHLFPGLQQGRIAQKPDFYLTDRDQLVWIGDAKYKHLAKGQQVPLSFAALDMGEGEDRGNPAGRRISPEDVRQLTVYAELDRQRRGADRPAHLLLLYPYMGTAPAIADSALAWNGSRFFLVPVRLTHPEIENQRLSVRGVLRGVI